MEICADAEVMRFLGGPASTEKTLAASARYADHWATHGFGLWAVLERGTNRLAGFAGGCFPLWHPTVRTTPEVGWRLARWAWGRGYATEGGRLAVDALHRAGHEEILAFVDPGNDGSIAVAGRVGLIRRGPDPDGQGVIYAAPPVSRGVGPGPA